MTYATQEPDVEPTHGQGPEREGAPTIELVGLTKHYGETIALDDVSIQALQREFVVLLGPSGCGKSTVLKVIAGLEDATEGEVYIDGRLVNYVEPKRRNVAMVFQNYALYPHMTTERNIGFPLKMDGMPKREVAARVNDAVNLLDLGPELDRYPGQLSGGQRQRVALGRAIVRDPAAFLMDEPLSNLDALLRVQMREELMKLHQRLGRTMLYVTHDQLEAMTMADRIAVLRAGEVQQVGAPREVYASPANTFVASFVGSPQMALFEGRLERDQEGTRFSTDFVVPLPDVSSHDHGEQLTLGVRAEHVALTHPDERGAIPATVTHVEQAGADAFVRAELPGGSTCAVRVDAGEHVEEGDRVHVVFAADKLHLFDADGQRLEPDRVMPDPGLT